MSSLLKKCKTALRLSSLNKPLVQSSFANVSAKLIHILYVPQCSYTMQVKLHRHLLNEFKHFASIFFPLILVFIP